MENTINDGSKYVTFHLKNKMSYWSDMKKFNKLSSVSIYYWTIVSEKEDGTAVVLCPITKKVLLWLEAEETYQELINMFTETFGPCPFTDDKSLIENIKRRTI